jgi:density-regulated protein DRP1
LKGKILLLILQCPAGSSSDLKKDDEVKRLPGGKVKKKEKPEVVVEKIVRNKRKCVTIIKGLDMFGIKLSEASKKLGKKFASGASVVKGPTEKEQIDVQGDIMYDIVDFITDTWKSVPESAIYFIEDGRKVSATA